MFRKMATVVLGGGWLTLIVLGQGCDPGGGPPLFFEPINDLTGESQMYLVPLGANLAAGPDELGDLSSRTTSARYNLTNRHVPFMLTGDITAGTRLEALELPAVPASADERTTSIAAFDPRRWESFRIVDRGECSYLAGWDLIAELLSSLVVDELNADSDVKGATLERSELVPRLRATIPGPSIVGRDVDELSISLDIAADHIGRNVKRARDAATTST